MHRQYPGRCDPRSGWNLKHCLSWLFISLSVDYIIINDITILVILLYYCLYIGTRTWGYRLSGNPGYYMGSSVMDTMGTFPTYHWPLGMLVEGNVMDWDSLSEGHTARLHRWRSSAQLLWQFPVTYIHVFTCSLQIQGKLRLKHRRWPHWISFLR